MKRLYSIVGMVSIALLLVMAPVNANADSFTVYALGNSSSGGTGFDTGIVLSAGQMFTVSVAPNDLWNAGALPRWSNADGLIAFLYATGADEESGQSFGTLIGQPFSLWTQNGLSAPFGSLVGELSGTYFLLGTNFSGTAPAPGTLNLYYWDANNEDNTGFLAAVVNINAVPEPATMLLFGLGLLGLAGLRRKLKK